MTDRILTTERLVMSPVSTDDFGELLTLWSDEDFTRHIMGRALGREELWFRLLRDLGHWAAMGHGNWTIRLRDGGAYLGSVGVFDYRRELEPPFDAPELGWGVAPGFQGRGYAAEALTAALAWTDRRLEGRTVCMISPENLASLKLAARVGYRPYATTTYKDHPVQLFERPRRAP
ncbi:MAG: RimJ/RimL family protein N-acetyltransferase [Brevundimonas sp.]|uniref:GNAT family N-acetyltransferase n=1 Tax=Brevundimonas sp. GW460-12-10-14-LB2 TaxID=1827469 RepID=UPI0007BCDA74|nr:GNAT family N-acetyltransferase [Brevundimonas sp. GW460-12-10-14-LB2]ANC52297.1 acetyltransferase [Brevundimonas sp. GW460-12-10-14-LB2]MEA3472751.1 GNAT family N-acetyltransferase [Pseudomonadota bacterium]